MKLKHLFLLVCFVFVLQVHANEEDVFDVTIENDNLIVCVLKRAPIDAQYLELRLKGGKKIRITPVKNELCNSMFYLNSSQAKQVKKKGVKSIIFYGASYLQRIDINERQNEQFLSSLP